MIISSSKQQKQISKFLTADQKDKQQTLTTLPSLHLRKPEPVPQVKAATATKPTKPQRQLFSELVPLPRPPALQIQHTKPHPSRGAPPPTVLREPSLKPATATSRPPPSEVREPPHKPPAAPTRPPPAETREPSHKPAAATLCPPPSEVREPPHRPAAAPTRPPPAVIREPSPVRPTATPSRSTSTSNRSNESVPHQAAAPPRSTKPTLHRTAPFPADARDQSPLQTVTNRPAKVPHLSHKRVDHPSLDKQVILLDPVLSHASLFAIQPNNTQITPTTNRTPFTFNLTHKSDDHARSQPCRPSTYSKAASPPEDIHERHGHRIPLPRSPKTPVHREWPVHEDTRALTL